MPGLITVPVLLARPGFDDLDAGQGAALIDDASALVRLVAAGELDDVESPDCPAAIVPVLVSMIRRGLDNPKGNAQETLGDYSYTAGSQGSVATLYLTRRERKIVRSAVGLSGVGYINMTGELPTQRSETAGGGSGGSTADYDVGTLS
jgi:hypothetical protein